MHVKAYAIYDEKAGLFSMPFFLQGDVFALRSIRESFSVDNGSPVAKYPSEFSLFAIGEFDDNIGSLSSPMPPRNLGLISTIINGSL